MKVTVRAPATSANLGPGFDCLGLALDIWADGDGRDRQSEHRRRSTACSGWSGRASQAAFEGVGAPPDVRIEADGGIPIARGLGASAALRAAGLLAGNALLDNLHDAEALLALGTRLEGHPDNMSPCLFGGLQVNVRDADGLCSTSPRRCRPTCRSSSSCPTSRCRPRRAAARLPRQLSREDTVFNVSRVALLVAALGAGRYDLLDEATQDRIHQPVRSEIFKGLVPIMTAAKEGGAAASYLSGGGSTVAAFVQGGATPSASRGS